MRNMGSILNSKKLRLDDGGAYKRLPIRDTGKPTKLFIDNEYLTGGYADTFPPSVTMVYLALALRANHQTQFCYPSYARLRVESGVRNKTTLSNALKILEAHDVIAIQHSKGRYQNKYHLLHPQVWKAPNSTIIETIAHKKNGIKNAVNESQVERANSLTSETRNQLRESTKEIRGNSFKEKEVSEIPADQAPALPDESLWQELSPAARAVLPEYYSREQILRAIRDVKSRGLSVDSKPLHEALKRLGIEPLRPLPGWFSKSKMI